MNYLTEFKIQQLRTKNLTSAVESISAITGAVVINMLVPQLLLKFVYDPTTLVEAPVIFEILPLVTYSIAVLFFAYVMVSNFMRERKVAVLEQEMMIGADGCCGGDCNCGDDEINQEDLKELEKIVDEAIKPSRKVKASAKKAKKTSKK